MKCYVRLLEQHGPMTMRQLAVLAGVKVSTVSVGINNARKLGLVEPVGTVYSPGRKKDVFIWGACK
jgi:predicted transcriptional regulator